MARIYKKITLSWLVLTASCLSATAQRIGGNCECCEGLYQGMPQQVSWQTTITAKNEPGEPMEISGIVYQKDGRTPAPNVIVYVYHTDNEGLYSKGTGEDCARRHGHLRGWMKTDVLGRYRFVSIRPKPYPKEKFAAHIHVFIKEPPKNEYYIDEYEFEGDPFLPAQAQQKAQKRGGLGIIRLQKNELNVWVGKRDIVLGQNIPNY